MWNLSNVYIYEKRWLENLWFANMTEHRYYVRMSNLAILMVCIKFCILSGLLLAWVGYLIFIDFFRLKTSNFFVWINKRMNKSFFLPHTKFIQNKQEPFFIFLLLLLRFLQEWKKCKEKKLQRDEKKNKNKPHTNETAISI